MKRAFRYVPAAIHEGAAVWWWLKFQTKEVTSELARREVLVDYRANAGIRIAAHFYTIDEELDRAMDEIRSIVKSPAFVSARSAEG